MEQDARAAKPGAYCSSLLAKKYTGAEVTSITSRSGEDAEADIAQYYGRKDAAPQSQPARESTGGQ
jgi:hypothetical protein